MADNDDDDPRDPHDPPDPHDRDDEPELEEDDDDDPAHDLDWLRELGLDNLDTDERRMSQEAVEQLASLNAAFNRPAQERARLLAETRAGTREFRMLSEVMPRFAIYEDAYFWDNVKCQVLTPEQFERCETVVRAVGFREDRMPSPMTIMTRSPAAMRVETQVSAPGEGIYVKALNAHDQPVIAANVWRPSSVKVAPRGCLDPVEFIGHIDWMVPNPKEALLLKQVLAWCVQNPSEYLPLITMLWGEGRVGKDLILSAFGRVVGNTRTVYMAQLNSRFDGFLLKTYVKVPEFTLSGPKGAEMWDKLKAWTGEQASVELDIKYKPMTFSRISPRLFVTSNEPKALKPVGADDRRLLVIGCLAMSRDSGSETAHGSPAYFTKLAALLKDESYLGRIARWLSELDVSEFNPNQAIHTTTRSHLLRSAMGTTGMDIYDLVVGGPLSGRQLVTTTEIELMVASREFNGTILFSAMRRAGWRKLKRCSVLPGRPTIYAGPLTPRNEFVRLMAASGEELAAAYEDELSAVSFITGN